MTGRPAAVFTENKDPDKESSTENNLPEVPSTVNNPEPDPFKDVLPDTSKEPDVLEAAMFSV